MPSIKIKNLLPQNTLKTLYFALVHSYLSYCINIYSCTSQQNIKRIFLKQKEAIRVIANANYRDHTPPLFKNLKILPLEKMIELSKLKFMHDYVFDRLPLSFAETWVNNRQRNPLNNLRNADLYYQPQPNFELFRRFPLYTFPTAWNAADDNKYNPNRYTFKRSQKDAMFENLS